MTCGSTCDIASKAFSNKNVLKKEKRLHWQTTADETTYHCAIPNYIVDTSSASNRLGSIATCFHSCLSITAKLSINLSPLIFSHPPIYSTLEYGMGQIRGAESRSWIPNYDSKYTRRIREEGGFEFSISLLLDCLSGLSLQLGIRKRAHTGHCAANAFLNKISLSTTWRFAESMLRKQL